jgi:hypothetical protein
LEVTGLVTGETFLKCLVGHFDVISSKFTLAMDATLNLVVELIQRCKLIARDSDRAA